ncbi:Transposon Ty3-I Gag-Pol polyprotein [Sparassis crispa]|uniref:Transposon Ty3-I Gag-Pol polyprotein n=1 Tax=Sparassis crispa TaxID=139825 RepID=A0A401GSW8_9APHY|nr:Transposon Ty3-I Gag-Pol polyprotein [Sparassis crispa]GBE85306.1 Transposon Ty3-I Gag-Pol polyprotein [Sparassis crispa]
MEGETANVVDVEDSPRAPTPDALEAPSTHAKADSPTDAFSRLSMDGDHFLHHISEAAEGIDLPEVLRGQYSEDSFFKIILEDPKRYKNFLVKGRLVFMRDKHLELLCIPDILVENRSVREIIIAHAHSLLAHLVRDVQKYCDTCMTCKRSKPSNQKPYGLLNPLPVPSHPWEAIGIDFVRPLPESKDRDASYDSITVIIDLLTAMVHLVPSRTTYTAKNVAELVFAEVYKHHGMPKAIVSDRDVLFTSQFWSHLHGLLGVELQRANRTVTQMLRQCISPSQKDWVSRLPAIEFAINLARSDSTGYAPFFLNTGRMPRPMIWNNAGTEEFAGVRAYAQRVKAAVMAAHDSVIAARVKQTRDNLSLPKGLARKFIPKYIGPYKILQDYGNNSYQVDLPRNLKRRGVHDVFHASLLRIHEPNDDRLFPGRLDSQIAELEDRDEEWVIDKIVGHAGAGTDAIFEAVWRSGDRSWVPYGSISHLGALQAYLEALGLDGITQLPPGTGTPPPDPQIFVGNLEFPGGRGKPINTRTRRSQHQRKQPACTPTPVRVSSTSPAPITNPLTLLYLNPALFFAEVMAPHAFLTQLENHDIILCDGYTHEHHFTVAQLRSYSEFDVLLHRGWPDIPIPGGYKMFIMLWNRDAACTYKFTDFSFLSHEVTVSGEPIDIDYLAPLPPPPPPLPPALPPALAALAPNGVFDEELIQTICVILWGQIRRNQQFVTAKRKERAAAKEEKIAKKPRVFGAPDEDKGAKMASSSKKGKTKEKGKKKHAMPRNPQSVGGSSTMGTTPDDLEKTAAQEQDGDHEKDVEQEEKGDPNAMSD